MMLINIQDTSEHIPSNHTSADFSSEVQGLGQPLTQFQAHPTHNTGSSPLPVLQMLVNGGK